jgi:hypothetical protein
MGAYVVNTEGRFGTKLRELKTRPATTAEGAISAFRQSVEELVRQVTHELDEERRRASASVDTPDELGELAAKCEGRVRELIWPRRDI